MIAQYLEKLPATAGCRLTALQPTTGWPATLHYPTSTSGYRLQLAYDYQNGQLKRVRNTASGTVYREALSTNAWSKLRNESLGNGIAGYTEYDPANGWPFKRQAGVGGGTGSIDAQGSWDRNGNFTTREDLKQLTHHAVAVSLQAST